MARLKLSPTRSNLLVVRQRLHLAREGYELLDKKRDVLIMEILRLIEDAERTQRQVEEQFARAGPMPLCRRRGPPWAANGCAASPFRTPKRWTCGSRPRSIMGVVVPSLSYTMPERQLFYGFGDTSVVLDQVQQEWADVLALMGELAETVTTVWRLATELCAAPSAG